MRIIRLITIVSTIVMCTIFAPRSMAIQQQTVENIRLGIESADSFYRKQKYIDALDGYISQLGKLHHNEADSLYLTILSRIGTIYDIYEDYGRAFYYYEKVLSHDKAQEYDDIYSKMLVKMMVCYFNSEDAKNAGHYYRLQLAHPMKDKQLAEYYKHTNGGLVKSLEGEHKQALAFFHKSLHHCISNGMQPVFRVPVMLEMANSFSKIQQPDSAIKYLQMALAISEDENLDSYATDCYNQLYRVYREKGDSIRAVCYLEKYTAASDSLAERKKLETANLRLLQSHDVQAREEINSLNDRIDLQSKTLLFIFLFCLAVTVFAIYTRRQHLRLKESYRMLINKSDEIYQLEDQRSPLAPAASQAQQVSKALQKEQSEAESEIAGGDQPQTNPLLERINSAMADIDLISRPSFSLADLSREVGSNTKYVSALINEAYGKNFRTILNERRIREATKRLSDTQTYGECSIADIAESLGYSSSTVFISAFKKVIGMTPAVYRRYRDS